MFAWVMVFPYPSPKGVLAVVHGASTQLDLGLSYLKVWKYITSNL